MADGKQPGFVGRLGQIAVGGFKESVSDYFRDVTSLKNDADTIKNQLIQDGKSAADVFNRMKKGMGSPAKKIHDWFYSNEASMIGFSDGEDDFDAGFKPDEAGAEISESEVRNLNAEDMTDIAKKQTAEQYKIASKQADLNIANTAEIVSAINSRSAEMTASINKVNESLITISKKLDGIMGGIDEGNKEQKKQASIFNNDGSLSLAGMFNTGREAFQEKTEMLEMAKTFARFFTPQSLASMGFNKLFEKEFSFLGGKSVEDLSTRLNNAIVDSVQSGLMSLAKSEKFADFFNIGSRNKNTDFQKYVTNNYTTKPAVFDGMTRQSIIHIIPEYLKNIEAAITNSAPKTINEKGQLTTKTENYFQNNIGSSMFGSTPMDYGENKTNLLKQIQSNVAIGSDFKSKDLDLALKALKSGFLMILLNGIPFGSDNLNNNKYRRTSQAILHPDELMPGSGTAQEAKASAVRMLAQASGKSEAYWSDVLDYILGMFEMNRSERIKFSRKCNTEAENVIKNAEKFAKTHSHAYQAGKITFDLVAGAFTDAYQRATYKDDKGTISGTQAVQHTPKPSKEEQPAVDSATTSTPQSATSPSNNQGETHNAATIIPEIFNGPSGIPSITSGLKNICDILSRGLDVFVVNKKGSFGKQRKPFGRGGSGGSDSEDDAQSSIVSRPSSEYIDSTASNHNDDDDDESEEGSDESTEETDENGDAKKKKKKPWWKRPLKGSIFLGFGKNAKNAAMEAVTEARDTIIDQIAPEGSPMRELYDQIVKSDEVQSVKEKGKKITNTVTDKILGKETEEINEETGEAKRKGGLFGWIGNKKEKVKAKVKEKINDKVEKTKQKVKNKIDDKIAEEEAKLSDTQVLEATQENIKKVQEMADTAAEKSEKPQEGTSTAQQDQMIVQQVMAMVEVAMKDGDISAADTMTLNNLINQVKDPKIKKQLRQAVVPMMKRNTPSVAGAPQKQEGKNGLEKGVGMGSILKSLVRYSKLIFKPITSILGAGLKIIGGIGVTIGKLFARVVKSGLSDIKYGARAVGRNLFGSKKEGYENEGVIKKILLLPNRLLKGFNGFTNNFFPKLFNKGSEMIGRFAGFVTDLGKDLSLKFGEFALKVGDKIKGWFAGGSGFLSSVKEKISESNIGQRIKSVRKGINTITGGFFEGLNEANREQKEARKAANEKKLLTSEPTTKAEAEAHETNTILGIIKDDWKKNFDTEEENNSKRHIDLISKLDMISELLGFGKDKDDSNGNGSNDNKSENGSNENKNENGSGGNDNENGSDENKSENGSDENKSNENNGSGNESNAQQNSTNQSDSQQTQRGSDSNNSDNSEGNNNSEEEKEKKETLREKVERRKAEKEERDAKRKADKEEREARKARAKEEKAEAKRRKKAAKEQYDIEKKALKQKQKSIKEEEKRIKSMRDLTKEEKERIKAEKKATKEALKNSKKEYNSAAGKTSLSDRFANAKESAAGGAGTIAKGVSGTLGGIFKAVGGVAKILMAIFSSLAGFQTLMDLIQNTLTKSLTPLNNAFQKAIKVIKPVLKIVKDSIKTIATSFNAILESLIDSIQPILEDIIGPLMEKITPIITQIGDILVSLLPLMNVIIEVLLMPLVTRVLGVLIPAISMISSLTQMLAGAIELFVGRFMSGIGLVLQAIGKGIGAGGVGKAGKTMKDKGEELVESSKEMLAAGMRGFGSGLSAGFAAVFGIDIEDEEDEEDEEEKEKKEPEEKKEPDPMKGSALEGLTGMGDTTIINNYNNSSSTSHIGDDISNIYGSGESQRAYGGYLGMDKHGCGPTALADAASRRSGQKLSAGALASAMAKNGSYSDSKGTSVAGFINTSAALGSRVTPGGVSQASLKRATPNNPVTLIGSGSGFGTKSGNNHYVNVVGSNGKGTSYVSNPLSGRIERRSTSDLVGHSVLGLYGSGDDVGSGDYYTFPEAVSDAIAELKGLAASLLKMFTGPTQEEQMHEEVDKIKQEEALKEAKNQLGDDFEQYNDEALAMAAEDYRAKFPKLDSETDDEYEIKIDKYYAKNRMKYLAKTKVLEDASEKSGNMFTNILRINDETIEAVNSSFDEVGTASGASSSSSYGVGGGAGGVYNSDGSAKMFDFGKVTHKETNITSGESGESPVHDFFGAMGESPTSTSSRIGQWYYLRHDPNNKGVGQRGDGIHHGIDISWESGNAGKPLYTITDGTVVSYGYDSGRGNHIQWTDDSGKYNHVYMHMQDLPTDLKRGDRVEGGVFVGHVGNTGNSQGAHLHYGVLDSSGNDINPLTYWHYEEPADLPGDTNRDKIWSYMVAPQSGGGMGFSKHAAAGIMGNMDWESKYEPRREEDNFADPIQNTSYNDNVDNGSYSASDFIYDRIGFGLVQWTPSDRKEGLWNATRGKNMSIGNLRGQLDYFREEMEGKSYYASMLERMRSGDPSYTYMDAMEEFLKKYEIPDNIPYNKTLRGPLAKKVYEAYENTQIPNSIDTSLQKKYETVGSGTNTNTGPIINSEGTAKDYEENRPSVGDPVTIAPTAKYYYTDVKGNTSRHPFGSDLQKLDWVLDSVNPDGTYNLRSVGGNHAHIKRVDFGDVTKREIPQGPPVPDSLQSGMSQAQIAHLTALRKSEESRYGTDEATWTIFEDYAKAYHSNDEATMAARTKEMRALRDVNGVYIEPSEINWDSEYYKYLGTRGSGDSMESSIISNIDANAPIPPLDGGMLPDTDFWTGMGLGANTGTSVYNITKTDDKAADARVKSILDHTFEVKSASIEKILIKILDRIEEKRTETGKPLPMNAPLNQKLFEERIPSSISKLSIG